MNLNFFKKNYLWKFGPSNNNDDFSFEDFSGFPPASLGK